MRSKFPANDAGAAEVMQYYADHRAVTLALAVLMPIGLVGLTTFLGAVLPRVARGAGRARRRSRAPSAQPGSSPLHDAHRVDVAIAGYIHRGAADAAVVDGMWVVHNAVFGFLLASIGIALAGLTVPRSTRSPLHPLEQGRTRRWRPAPRRRDDHPGHHRRQPDDVHRRRRLRRLGRVRHPHVGGAAAPAATSEVPPCARFDTSVLAPSLLGTIGSALAAGLVMYKGWHS